MLRHAQRFGYGWIESVLETWVTVTESEMAFRNCGLITAQATACILGQPGSTIVLLLRSGDKSTQTKDIDLAKQYWNDYRRRS